MASWRETTTQQTQDDFDGLFNSVLPFAERSLSQHGEFYPFGAVTTVDGKVEMRAASPEFGDEHPKSAAVLDLLHEGARSESGALRAVAFVADVHIEHGDAIRIELESAEGVAIHIVVPYKRNRLTKKLTLGAMSVHAGERRVWPA